MYPPLWTIVVEVHPKFYFWRIPKRVNNKLLDLVTLKAILKHADDLLTCLNTLHKDSWWLQIWQLIVKLNHPQGNTNYNNQHWQWPTEFCHHWCCPEDGFKLESKHWFYTGETEGLHDVTCITWLCHLDRDSLTHCFQGSVAQLAEQRTSNPKIVRSNPILVTEVFKLSRSL